MPIFFHCWATISATFGHGTNAPPTEITSMRRRPFRLCAAGTPRSPSCVSPILSSSSFACLRSSVDHLVRHSGPGFCGTSSVGTMEPGRADAEEERLVDLIAVDAERQRVAEIAVPHPLRDLRVSLEALVEVERGVRAVEGGVQAQGVVTLLLVLQEDGQLAEVGVALLPVELTGDGAQVEHFEVLSQGQLDLVEVRAAGSRRIDRVVVRVPLQHPGRRVDRRDGLPADRASAARR